MGDQEFTKYTRPSPSKAGRVFAPRRQMVILTGEREDDNLYLDPQNARELAAGLIAAAEHAEEAN